ncbi:MAG: hypothetical protein ACOYMA_12265 [Bacteroidia bacterium]
MAKKKQRVLNFKPNYLYYWMLWTYNTNRKILDLNSANEKYPLGQKRKVKLINLGGTRSSKTYDEIHFIYKYCVDNAGKNKHIKVFRETLVDCREKTLLDFKKCFGYMGLEKDLDYTLVGEGAGGKPIITICGNIIEFKGYPEDGKQEGDSNVVFVNEILETKSKDIFDNIIQRCTELVICDANPNLTEHFIFHLENEFNTFYSNTTYLDNDHLIEGLQADYESKCPYMLEDSHIEIVDPIPAIPIGQNEVFFNGFRKRVWDKPECRENETYDPLIHRRINEVNTKAHSVNRVWWYIMAEGLPIARDGAIFADASWVQEFPNIGFDEVVLSMDFGYTKDNTTLIRTGRSGMDAYIEAMCCQPTKTPEITFNLIEPQLKKELARRKAEGNNSDELWICCESQDTHGTETWVLSLNEIAYSKGLNWNFFKISKRSILAGVEIMLKFRLFLVEQKTTSSKLSRFRLEQQNYMYKTVNGETTNEPDPNSKFCDIWDGARYGFQHNFLGVNS